MNRYSRQMLFAPIGEEGQRKLQNSSILIVGVGALGTVIANHFTRAGVGHIRLVDRDFVDQSNLQRQMLFTENDAAKMIPKAIAAKRVLETYNSDVNIEAIIEHVSHQNIDRFLEEVDIVFDGTDNFSTRYILNDSCFKKNIPFSYGGVVSSRGMTALFRPQKTSCFRCLFSEQQNSGETCDTVGVISPVVDLVSSIQVAEGLKYLTGNIEAIEPVLRTFDMWKNESYNIQLPKKQTNCPVCTNESYPALDASNAFIEQTMCGRNSVQIISSQPFDLNRLEKQMSDIGEVTRTPFLLKVDVPSSVTFVLFPNGRALVQGTDDLVVARTMYDRYVGSYRQSIYVYFLLFNKSYLYDLRKREENAYNRKDDKYPCQYSLAV